MEPRLKPLFTEAALGELYAIEEGLVETLIAEYKPNGALLISRILEAAISDDFKTIERESHSLKSSSQVLGLLRLADLCLQIETAAHGGSFDVGASSELLACYQESVQELDAHLTAA